jgi:cytochrome c biogenesis protein CcmG, thiol:disulfide interchange protein DsbE
MTERLTPTDTMPSTDVNPADGISRRRLLVATPAIGFGAITILLAVGLAQKDHSKLPSVLIGKPVPRFSLPPVQARKLGLSRDDLHGEVSLINLFASWFVKCRAEHPQLMWLAEQKIALIHGLNYKDEPADAAKWLDTMGDPYTRTGADRDGRVAIDWGVYGVPETFIVGADGRIAHKHIGAVMENDLKETILPIVTRLRQGTNGGRS